MTVFNLTVQGSECVVRAPEPGQFDATDFFGRFLPSAQGWLGHDTEFTAGGMFVPGARQRLAQFATMTEAYVLDMTDRAQRAAAENVLRRPLWLVCHNGAAEASAAYTSFGIDLTAHGMLYDTMTLAFLSDPGELNDHDLKSLSEELIDDQLVKAEAELKEAFRELYGETHGKWKTKKSKGETVQVLDPDGNPIWMPARGRIEDVEQHGWTNIPQRHPAYLRYAGMDALYVRRLAPRLASRCRTRGVYDRIHTELSINNVAIRMHTRGWRVDVDEVDRQMDTVGAENAAVLAEYESRFGHSARSPKRADLLASQGIEFRKFTDKGNPELSKEAVRELLDLYPDNEALRLLYRQANTANVTLFLTTLRESIDSNGFVHPNIKPLGAVSGRWTVTRPAVQTVSSKSGTRRVFIPRPGHVKVSSDLPQIEVRIAAAEAGAHRLIQDMKDGVDPYSGATRLAFGEGFTPFQRKLFKRVILGTMYASGVDTLVQQAKYVDGWAEANVEDITEARRQFQEAVPEIKALANRVQRENPVRLASGRFVPVDPKRIYRNINSVGQGNGRDYLMDCMLRAVGAGLDDYLLMALHDELLLDVPANELTDVVETLRECMSAGYKGVPTPPDTEIFPEHWAGAGISWADWQAGVRDLP